MAAIEINISKTLKAEERIHEIAFVTPQKAPELLSVFTDAFKELIGAIGTATLELKTAQRQADKRRSLVILDEAPKILKQKGLVKDSNPAGSADLREAVLSLDEEYLNLLNKVDYIAAIQEILRGKLKGIDMAYMAVKKVIGENVYNYDLHKTSAPNETPDAFRNMFGDTQI